MAINTNDAHRILIVGGSLTGLTCALALARHGLPSTVIERVEAKQRTGGGLWVDGPLLREVTGLKASSSSGLGSRVALEHYEPTSWLALHDWLRDGALREDLITLLEGATVESVSADRDTASASLSNGDVIRGDLLIGCDGYRSVVRTVINPEKPEASYAGYMLWRGLVDERDLPQGTMLTGRADGFRHMAEAEYRLVAYPVPGVDGSLVPGKRQVSFSWFDAGRLELLRRTDCVSEDGFVLRTITSSMIPPDVRAELDAFATANWPDPWRAVVLHAIRGDALFGTPIAQYDPPAIVRGRLAIAGDAAHVASPMTARGFQTGVEDAASVALACRTGFRRGTGFDASTLQGYAADRLPAAHALARSSREMSERYLREATLELGR